MTDLSHLWLLTFRSSFEQTEHLAALLENHCLSVSWFEYKDESQFCWQLEAIFDNEPEAEWLDFVCGNQEYAINPLPNCDWLRQNRQSFPVLHIGQFHIYGSHHDQTTFDSNFSFKIDAATAFGTGQHGTTRGCLLALEDLKDKDLKIQKFLDLGCGTAILAMATAKLFNCEGVAADCDPEAVNMAWYNVVENKLEDKIKVLVSQGFADLELSSSFDLIAANILARPLIDLSKEMAQFTTDHGYIVLSGLLQIQQEEVQKVYEKHGFALMDTYPQDEWITLVMRKRKITKEP